MSKFPVDEVAKETPTRRGVVVIATAQLHSTKPELRFCAGSNPALTIVPAGNKAKRLSSVNHATKTIHHHHHHTVVWDNIVRYISKSKQLSSEKQLVSVILS